MAYKIKSIFLLTYLLCNNLGFSQIIDTYGFKVGYNKSNQTWDYSNNLFKDFNFNEKAAYEIFINAEKKINECFSVRLDFGFKQKGFLDNFTQIHFTTVDNTDYNIEVNDYAIFHNISTNLNLKYRPFLTNFRPYLLGGLSYDYIFKYKDVEFQTKDGINHPLFSIVLDKLNKGTFGFVLGFGIEFNNLYLEYNYNSPKTLYESSNLLIKDQYSSFSIGYNVNL